MKTTHYIGISLFTWTVLVCSSRAQSLSIAQQPTNQTVLLGGSATFSVDPGGTPPFSYNWQMDGTNMTGETQPTLSIPVAHHADFGSYDVIVSNAAGSITSSVVTLKITGGRPLITLLTNTPSYNVVSIQYTVAPNVNFELFEGHDITPPIQWYGGAYIGASTSGTNLNWSYFNATNYTEFYPKTFWMLDPYP